MNKLYKLFFVVLCVFACVTSSYAVKLFTPDQVKTLHSKVLEGVNSRCVEQGNSAGTCHCLAQLIDNKLDDNILINCDANSREEAAQCLTSFVHGAEGAINPTSKAMCEKNPSSAQVGSSGHVESLKMRILVIFIGLIVLGVLLKMVVFK